MGNDQHQERPRRAVSGRARKRAIRAEAARYGVPYSVAARRLEAFAGSRATHAAGGRKSINAHPSHSAHHLDTRMAADLPCGRARHLTARFPTIAHTLNARVTAQPPRHLTSEALSRHVASESSSHETAPESSRHTTASESSSHKTSETPRHRTPEALRPSAPDALRHPAAETPRQGLRLGRAGHQPAPGSPHGEACPDQPTATRQSRLAPQPPPEEITRPTLRAGASPGAPERPDTGQTRHPSIREGGSKPLEPATSLDADQAQQHDLADNEPDDAGDATAQVLALAYAVIATEAPHLVPSAAELTWSADLGQTSAVDVVCSLIDRTARLLLDSAPGELRHRARGALAVARASSDPQLRDAAEQLTASLDPDDARHWHALPFAEARQVLDALLVAPCASHSPGVRVRFAAGVRAGTEATVIGAVWGMSGPPYAYKVRPDGEPVTILASPTDLVAQSAPPWSATPPADAARADLHQADSAQTDVTQTDSPSPDTAPAKATVHGVRPPAFAPTDVTRDDAVPAHGEL
jgi:hypothetical protein